VSAAKTSNASSAANAGSGQIGMAAAVSIGIGGMVGAGIFSILGVVAQAAGNAMWLAFAIGGVVALLSTYSYARLGATFPSAGGAVHFLVKSFGDGILAGGLNLFMWAGYIISLALYATAFGSYAATFVTDAPSLLLLKSLAVGSVVLLTVINANHHCGHQGGDPRPVCRGGLVLHQPEQPFARAVARHQVGPVRSRRAVHRL
jgi:amino acid transporter